MFCWVGEEDTADALPEDVGVAEGEDAAEEGAVAGALEAEAAAEVAGAFDAFSKVEVGWGELGTAGAGVWVADSFAEAEGGALALSETVGDSLGAGV